MCVVVCVCVCGGVCVRVCVCMVVLGCVWVCVWWWWWWGGERKRHIARPPRLGGRIKLPVPDMGKTKRSRSGKEKAVDGERL